MRHEITKTIAGALILAAVALPNAGCKHKKEEGGKGKEAASEAGKGAAREGEGAEGRGAARAPGCPAGMALIKAGSFTMGCSAGDTYCRKEETPTPVKLTRDFCVDTREVTQGEYEKVKKKNPSFFKQCGPDCPVEQVMWTEAQSYCEKLGGRLPTEAEWEYASRGGSPARFFWGDVVDGNYAWYAANSANATHPVAKKQPNAYGLYDMLGNVWEWTADRYEDYPGKPLTDPKGANKGQLRVLRGGAFSNNEGLLRVSSRDKSMPGAYNRYIGFRCAKNAQ